MNCSKCGSPLREGKKFCGNCGTRVPEAGTVPLSGGSNKAGMDGGQYCNKCGSPVVFGKNFCSKCGNQIGEVESQDLELVTSAGFLHWNILPGQLAVRIDEKDLAQYKDTKGVVIQDGLKALFFTDGALAGELAGGKYPFKDMGVQKTPAIKRFFSHIASFFTGRSRQLVENAGSISIVLLREAEFPLIFSERGIPTAGVHSDVAIHITARITNILEFYRHQLLDRKFVGFQQFSQSLEPSVRTILEDQLRGVDAEALSGNTQIRQEIQSALEQCISDLYPYVSFSRLIRMTAEAKELESILQLREELYVSEKELVELSRRNDFLNRLNDVQNQQILQEAQTQVDFAVAMDKIDQQNALAEDERAQFADMLYWQRQLREAGSRDEGEAALAKLEQNGLLRQEELEVLKADIDQRKKYKELTDGQALALLTMQNDMALDQQKLQWEIEVGNKRFQNEFDRQRQLDEYADTRRERELELDKREMADQLELLHQAQTIRQEREEQEHRRQMESANAQRQHEQELRRIFQNMTPEQIMAANPDINPAAAAALAEKFKVENVQLQVDLVNKHSQEIQRIMQDNASQQTAITQQLIQMMVATFAGQQAQKDAAIQDIRTEANVHQDRLTAVLNTASSAAFGAAGSMLNGMVLNAMHQQPRGEAKAMSACTKCGGQKEADASFCSDCGAAQ